MFPKKKPPTDAFIAECMAVAHDRIIQSLLVALTDKGLLSNGDVAALLARAINPTGSPDMGAHGKAADRHIAHIRSFHAKP